MPAEFTAFSPESFEQFVRSLAMSVFGPGVSAFGNGPDGGREATFKGIVSYPNGEDRWNGYGVIQAKFKERIESCDKDQRWALKQLTAELTKLSQRTSGQKPEYYVFVTNVDLSSVAGGGRDQADDTVLRFYPKLKLKGHAVWDANQITTLLTNNERVRRAFRAYLTPSDVLSELIDHLNNTKSQAGHAIVTSVERYVRYDACARLDQAGNKTDETIRLAKVFIDLPTSRQYGAPAPTDNIDTDDALPPGILSELVRYGTRKLDPENAALMERGSELDDYTKFVILGGPGSGKSTVTQFLAQIHRVGFLRNAICEERLGPETRLILDEIAGWCEDQEVAIPLLPRLPIRVELPRYSKQLAASNGSLSLERYIASLIAPNTPLVVDSLLKSLVSYPMLLILDGLDEVPVTSNRSDVMREVDDFLAEARMLNADLFLVVTSRHNGYEDEFSGNSTAFRHVRPLSHRRAMAYVKGYTGARYALDPNKADDILAIMDSSARSILTNQLLTTPLQVTFMVTVVAASGNPARDRWQLFSKYYRTIYDREQQKAVAPYDEVLSAQPQIIDRLHHDVGFWLQYRGETSGKDTAGLSFDWFARLTNHYLAEAGQTGETLSRLQNLITGAARNRLVFLNSRIQEELSFDVRSLQEYMAAECIMAGHQPTVLKRLNLIAPTPYWRNVFLFAVGKCFSNNDTRHLQDSVRAICQDLKPSGSRASWQVTGSELALDILESGCVGSNPFHARHLIEIAFEGLRSIPEREDDPARMSIAHRLSKLYQVCFEDHFRDELERRLSLPAVAAKLGAWELTLRLVEAGHPFATKIGESFWPELVSDQSRLLQMLPVTSIGGNWTLERILELSGKVSIADFSALVVAMDRAEVGGPIWFELFSLPLGLNQYPVILDCDVDVGLEFELGGLVFADGYQAWRDVDDLLEWSSAAYRVLRLAGRFAAAPSSATLADALDEDTFESLNELAKVSVFRAIPWPLRACLASSRHASDLRRFREAALTGGLGELEDWLQAQKRWAERSINRSDLVYAPSEDLPFDQRIGSVGVPSCVEAWVSYRERDESILTEIVEILTEVQSPLICDSVTFFLGSVCSDLGGFRFCMDLETARKIFLAESMHFHTRLSWLGSPSGLDINDEWWQFYDEICLRMPFHIDSLLRHEKLNAEWAEYFLAQDWRKLFEKEGLKRLIGHLCLGGIVTEVDHVQVSAIPKDWPELVILIMKSQSTEAAESSAVVFSTVAEESDRRYMSSILEEIAVLIPDKQFRFRFLETACGSLSEHCIELTALCQAKLRELSRVEMSEMQKPKMLHNLDLPNLLALCDI